MHSFLQNNIALVLNSQGKYPEALEMHQNVLRVRVAILGPDHPDVATTKVLRFFKIFFGLMHVCLLQNNIGAVYHAQGKFPEALEVWEEALRVRVATLGPEHLDVAKTYNKYDFFFSPLMALLTDLCCCVQHWQCAPENGQV